MIYAAVFDFDGVIVDTEPLHYRAFLRVLEPHAITFDYAQYLDRYVGYDDRDGFAAMLSDAGLAHLAPDRAALVDLCAQKADAFERLAEQGVPTIPGALELIDQLARRVPLAVASGASRRDIELVLGGLRLTDRFKTIVSADDVERSKPDPQTYRLAVERLADAAPPRPPITPRTCLAIEDTQAGAASARDAGLWVLGLVHPGREPIPQAHRCTPTLASLTADQLQSWFH